jgi:hypothetical protein
MGSGALHWIVLAVAAATVGCTEGDGWRVGAHPTMSSPEVCVGERLPDSAWDASASGPPLTDLDGGAGPELGEFPPAWALRDFQPQSCGYEAVYGLEAFRGRVTVLAILSGGWGYCRLQAGAMERLRIELEAAGQPTDFVAINLLLAWDHQQALVDVCAFPLFQETPSVLASLLHHANKDDFLIFDQEGRLARYLPYGGDVATNMNSDEGYENIKNAILELQ